MPPIRGALAFDCVWSLTYLRGHDEAVLHHEVLADGPERTPRDSDIAPNAPKVRVFGQDGPRRLQDGPQRPQDGPERTPRDSEIAPNAPKMAPR